jgi:3'(2'), 5'-bisphosphate nucleotidase
LTDAGEETDAQLARRIADTAGELLLALQRSNLFDGKALGKVGDRVANAFIMEALAENRPDDTVLSEEEAADPARLTQRRVWIVDPLDGTREYGERRTDWAVHIALAVDGVATIGAVAMPGMPATYCTERPTDAAPTGVGPLRMVVSRTRPAAEAVAVAEKLGARLLPMGSAGAKAMAVLRGEGDIYLHSGGQYEWDSAAPVAVALASGLYASRLDGSPLRYSQPDPWLPDLVVCHPDLADAVMDALAAFEGTAAE